MLYTEYQTIANDANTPESIKERRVQEIQERALRELLHLCAG